VSNRTPFATLTRAETLYQIIHGYYVDGGPAQPGPVLSGDITRVIAGEVIRDLALHIRTGRLQADVRELAIDLIRRGADEVIGNAESDGPPWTDLPFPFPWPPKKFSPRDSVFGGLEPGALDDVLAGVAYRLADAATTTLASHRSAAA
jgi:hypothetical protein